MKRVLSLFAGFVLFGLPSCTALFPTPAYADASDQTITSRTKEVDGVNLHYLIAGHGATVILLHGYAETSLMWKPIMPVLAERFTVIAPDLPGIGDSAIPANGLDMKTAAIRIHALARSLGVQKAEVVGHDIGLMVAYAYAAQFPAEVEKLVVMDAFLPGVGGWEAVYNNPGIWHFRFNGPTPEKLVQGRERTYFDYFWNDLAADKTPVDPGSRSSSIRGCLRASRTHAGGLGVLRFISASGEGFRRTLPDETDYAGTCDRRREISWRGAGPADEVGRHRRNGRRAKRYWALGAGGTS
jgi:pimeloyl-ACP methyl ester carboxylesterase